MVKKEHSFVIDGDFVQPDQPKPPVSAISKPVNSLGKTWRGQPTNNSMGYNGYINQLRIGDTVIIGVANSEFTAKIRSKSWDAQAQTFCIYALTIKGTTIRVWPHEQSQGQPHIIL